MEVMSANQEQQPTTTQKQTHNYYEDEINLVDIFSVLWSQRWFIAGFTLFFVVLAVVYVFIRTPLYEITAQIAPGIIGFDENDNSIRNVSPDDIAGWFSAEFYAELFDDNEGNLPDIKAEIISKTDNVKIFYYHKNPTEGEKTLGDIIERSISQGSKVFMREMNAEINIIRQAINEKSNAINKLLIEQAEFKTINKLKINNQIENANAKISLLTKKIETIRMNRVNAQSALDNSRKKINSINKNTEDIMKLRQQMILEGADKIALLMYSNVIQQNISFANSLQEQLLDLKKEINTFIDAENDNREQVDNLKIQILDLKLDRDESLALRDKKLVFEIEKERLDIETLKSKISNLSTVEIIRPPVSSIKPEKPEKIKIVLLSLIAGIIFSIISSFLRHFWISNKMLIREDIDA